ncbi:MAG TPA: protein kinase [Candidatus Sulfotelmatobacter sp.]|nr:protein kinase [Candidatus Sulfotelmatobacter sp.]
MGLASGSKLGPYEIQAALGAGGMGEVYRARDTRLDRTVAVKILPGHLSSNVELNARFEREARAVSALNHPNICHLYDIGTQDGTAFLVMEYLDGETLADRLSKGAMPLKQALEYGMQITQALATAHRAGILHRDLKPQNVMLTAGGAKLLDFGLAKAAPAVGGSASASGMTPSTPTMTIAELSSPAQALTRQGTVVGTFQYMAPEILQGAEADARSDIFSLGCVLYEMFTGRRAFEAKSQLGVMTSILEKDPEPVSRIVPALPAALDHVVKSCLEKNPDERFQTAQDVRLQLKWIADGGAEAASVAGAHAVAVAKKRSPLAWIVASVALLAAIGLGAAYVKVANSPKTVLRASILPPAGTSYVTMVPAAGPPVLSPDGTRMVFTARDEKGKVALYVRPLSSISAQSFPGTDNAMYPFWSFDGRDIGFFADGKLKRISASGGPAQVICDASNARGGTWNQDGVILFTPTVQSPLLRVAAAGGTAEPATKLDAAHVENSHRWPHFLPDGKHFLYWARSSLEAQEQDVYVGALGSLQVKRILTGVTTASYADGYLLYLREQTLMAQAFDLRRLEPTGEPTPIAEHIAMNAATAVPEFSASENGILVYQAGDAAGAWDIVWFGRDGKHEGSVAQQERYYYPSLSPDGERLSASLFNGTNGLANIWILDLKRGTKSRLTFGSGVQVRSLWSPDGKTIYYASDEKSLNHIYSKPADGSGSEQPVIEVPDETEAPNSISPDGRYLVYNRHPVSKAGQAYEIWALPLTGGGKPFPIVQTAFDTSNAAVSPAGKWMAYQSTESGRNEVFLTAFPGGGARWQVSTAGGTDAAWRGDGKELYFLDLSDSMMAVDVDVSGGTPKLGVPHVLFQAIGVQRQVGSYVVEKDGKRFLINAGSAKQEGEPLTLVTNWTAELKK